MLHIVLLHSARLISNAVFWIMNSYCCCCCCFVVDVVVFWGDHLQRSIRLCCFKSDRDEICHECSLSTYASIDRVRFLIWCHNFKMAIKTSFHIGKCCHLVSGQCTCSVCSADAAANAARWQVYLQFQIHSTLVVHTLLSDFLIHACTQHVICCIICCLVNVTAINSL